VPKCIRRGSIETYEKVRHKKLTEGESRIKEKRMHRRISSSAKKKSKIEEELDARLLSRERKKAWKKEGWKKGVMEFTEQGTIPG